MVSVWRYPKVMMFWAIVILASAVAALLLFVAFGIASRKTPDLLSGNVRKNMDKAPDPVSAETKATIGTAETPPIPMEWEAWEAPVMAQPQNETLPMITGKFASEPNFDEAELMLREVKAMLLQGRPDRAVSHIRSAAGVDEELAVEFVEEVQQGLYG